MSTLLKSWPAFVKCLGYSERTLRKWHKISPIPFTKRSNYQQGRIQIEEALLKAWYKDVTNMIREIKSSKREHCGWNIAYNKFIQPLTNDN